VISKISALFEALTIAEVEATPPAQRTRFAQYARYWAEIADPQKPPTPKAGVLADLKDGRRQE
jgi:hypothetical protein